MLPPADLPACMMDSSLVACRMSFKVDLESLSMWNWPKKRSYSVNERRSELSRVFTLMLRRFDSSSSARRADSVSLNDLVDVRSLVTAVPRWEKGAELFRLAPGNR